MANRVIPVETKVKVMEECLQLVDVEEVAAHHGVSPRSIPGAALKAFRLGYESIAVLLLTGVVAELCNPQQIIQTASVQRLATRLERFLKKHGPAIL
jgi:hypothetical protein